MGLSRHGPPPNPKPEGEDQKATLSPKENTKGKPKTEGLGKGERPNTEGLGKTASNTSKTKPKPIDIDIDILCQRRDLDGEGTEANIYTSVGCPILTVTDGQAFIANTKAATKTLSKSF